MRHACKYKCNFGLLRGTRVMENTILNIFHINFLKILICKSMGSLDFVHPSQTNLSNGYPLKTNMPLCLTIVY